jgi:hypothetical protein
MVKITRHSVHPDGRTGSRLDESLQFSDHRVWRAYGAMFEERNVEKISTMLEAQFLDAITVSLAQLREQFLDFTSVQPAMLDSSKNPWPAIADFLIQWNSP